MQSHRASATAASELSPDPSVSITTTVTSTLVTATPPEASVSMVELKITGFGYTWIEGDFMGFGLAAVAGSIVAALLLPMLLLRLFGKWQYTGITANGGIADDRDQ